MDKFDKPYGNLDRGFDGGSREEDRGNAQEQPLGSPSAIPDALAPEPGTPNSPSTDTSSEDRYTIGEVVSTLIEDFPSLSVSKVRYLERRRLIQLERTSGGYRLFKESDIELLRTVLTLQENEYLPLDVIKHRIDRGIIQPGSRGTDDSYTLGATYNLGHLKGTSVPNETISYTREEFCDELGADSRFIEELISVGVLGRTDEGPRGLLDSRDLEIARMAMEMSKYGIQPRHLRGIVAAVEREAAMFKQVLNPELRSGDEKRVSGAMESARHLASVDSRLKSLIMASCVESLY